MKKKLTQEYLNECLTYNSDTGVFVWNTRHESHFKNSHRCNNWNVKNSGKECGYIHTETGYRIISVDGKQYKGHRLAFLYMEGYLPENQVDHIDRVRANNRWSNLREVSQQCNMQNQNLYKNNTSGVSGISWHKRDNNWSTKIGIGRRVKHLGSFDNFEDAVMRRYYEEVNNPEWVCSVDSGAYKYLKDNNLLEAFYSTDFTKSDLISTNTSGVEGVSWHKIANKWVAKARIDNKVKYLGVFKSFDDAVMARYKAELNNPGKRKSVESTAYKYLKERNLI